MAVDLFSESPRISFSHDISQLDIVPVEQIPHFRSTSPSNSIDFDFCVYRSFDQTYNSPSSADELFLDGKILPTQIKKKDNNFPSTHTHPSPQNQEISSSIELLDPTKVNDGEEEDVVEDDHKKQSTKSFWKFNRSRSLNCGGNGYGGSLCPLPLLSRSNSTGSASVSSGKRPPLLSKEGRKQNPQKVYGGSIKSSSSSSSQKPPLMRSSYGGSSSSSSSSCSSYGVHVNPVLNCPSRNLFGLGSMLFKDKSKRK